MTSLTDGAVYFVSDPGEPSTGRPRISVNTEEAELLAFLATGRTVLEIGTGLGMSTRYLAGTAESVTTIDIDPWVQAQVWPHLPESVTTLASRRTLEHATFDMVFIDGDHRPDAVAEDMAFAVSHCPVGVIVVHDYDETRGALTDWKWFVVPTRNTVGITYVGWGR